jgi:hypothetical protein
LHCLVRIGRARTFFAIPLLRPACQQKATVSTQVRAKKLRRAAYAHPSPTKNRRDIAVAAADEDAVVARQRR